MLTPLGTVPDTETVIEFTREEDNSSRTGEQSRKSTSQGESGGSGARGRHIHEITYEIIRDRNFGKRETGGGKGKT